MSYRTVHSELYRKIVDEANLLCGILWKMAEKDAGSRLSSPDTTDVLPEEDLVSDAPARKRRSSINKFPDFSDVDFRTMDDKVRTETDTYTFADRDIALRSLELGPEVMLMPRRKGSSRFRVSLWRQTFYGKGVADLLKKHPRRVDEVPPPKLG